jgi:hypothetical protein
MNFQIGERIVAKFNYTYLNPDNIEIKLTKGNEYIVETTFRSNYSDGIIVKGDTGPELAYFYKHIFPFYTKEEKRNKNIEDILF